MDLEDAIRSHGGKAGQLDALADVEGVAEFIPPYVVKRRGEPFTSVQQRIERLRPPYLVRPSNPDDHFGLEGILPTFPEEGPGDEELSCELSTANDVRIAIGRMERLCDQRIRRYEELYGPTSRETHALVMERNPSQAHLVALRHPHAPRTLYFEISSGEGLGRWTAPFRYDEESGQATCRGQRMSLQAMGYLLDHLFPAALGGRSAGLLETHLKLIGRVERSGRIAPGWAHGYELGFDAPALFQVRPFMRYAPPAFGLDLSGIDPCRRTGFCFGQTEGTDLAWMGSWTVGDRSLQDFLRQRAGLLPAGVEGYFTQLDRGDMSAIYHSFLPETTLRSMRALAPPYDGAILHHNLQRIVKQRVTLMDLERIRGGPCGVRIVSNGAQGALLYPGERTPITRI